MPIAPAVGEGDRACDLVTYGPAAKIQVPWCPRVPTGRAHEG